MFDAEIVMLSSFLQEGQVVPEAFSTFHSFYLGLHSRQIGRQLHRRAILEMKLIIRFAFLDIDTFVLERSTEIVERLFEQLGQQEKRWTLVEAIPVL